MPVAGFGVGGTAPSVPTAAQLAHLATLQATAAAALVTYQAIVTPVTGTLPVAQAALLNANSAVNQYEAYIYGGQKPGIYDEGIPAGGVQGDQT
jgi:hypothetical protein